MAVTALLLRLLRHTSVPSWHTNATQLTATVNHHQGGTLLMHHPNAAGSKHAKTGVLVQAGRKVTPRFPNSGAQIASLRRRRHASTRLHVCATGQPSAECLQHARVL